MLQRLAQHIAWRLFISTVYTAGLTLLIPAVLLFILPESAGIVPPVASPTLLRSAAIMVGASFLVTVWFTHSVARSLTALGRLTFIPGLIGVGLAIFGRDMALSYLARTVPRFEEVKGLVDLYIDRAVPHVLYLTVGFFVLGAILLVLGAKIGGHAAAGRR